MKKIHKDKILNIPETDIHDNQFLFEYLKIQNSQNIQIIDLWEELKKYKNEEILTQVSQKPAMYSNVYSPKDELKIFTEIFDHAIATKTKTHIVGVTLDAEIKILEEYYTSLGFMREDINCFAPDFSVPFVTVSVNIENLMWKGSDYKRMREKIFFTPPVRESWENKAMFKWINRGVIAGIHIEDFWETEREFLSDCVKQEKILPLSLGKVLKYNLEEIGFDGEIWSIEVHF